MQRRIGDQPHCDRTGMPATGDQATKMTLRSRCGIGVKPLRVIGIGELAYVGITDDVRSSLYGLPDLELGELHSAPCRLRAMSILRLIMRPPASHADATMG